MDEVKADPTLYSLDSDLARIYGKVSDISKRMNDAIWGNNRSCAEDDEKAEMPAASLASLGHRKDSIELELNHILDMLEKFHQSRPVCSTN